MPILALNAAFGNVALLRLLAYADAHMRNLLFTLLHLAVVAARLCRPGGIRAVIAENLLLKHQLIVVRRARRRAPNLTPSDRLLCGFESLSSIQAGFESSPSPSAPRRFWRFIRRWCVASTGCCSQRIRVRRSPARKGRTRPS